MSRNWELFAVVVTSCAATAVVFAVHVTAQLSEIVTILEGMQ